MKLVLKLKNKNITILKALEKSTPYNYKQTPKIVSKLVAKNISNIKVISTI